MSKYLRLAKRYTKPHQICSKSSKERPLLKCISLLTCCFFFLANTLCAQEILNPPLSLESKPSSRTVDKILIPQELGSVQDEHRSGPASPHIVFIQDAHAIVDAQLNTQKLIEYLGEKYGVQLIAIEGGKGKLDPTFFRTFPQEDIRKRVLRQYLDLGEVTGAEMAAMTSPKECDYYGIENWDLYEKNYFAYLRAAKVREEVLRQIGESYDKLEISRQSVYSQKFNEFHFSQREFKDEKSSLLEFLKYIKSLPGALEDSASYPQLQMLLSSIEKDAGMNKENLDISIRRMADDLRRRFAAGLSKEQKMAWNSAYQSFVTGSLDGAAFLKILIGQAEAMNEQLPLTLEMKELLGHADTLSMIKGTKLFGELGLFLVGMENRIATKAEEKELAEKYRKLDLLRELAHLEVDIDQITQYRSAPAAFNALLARPEFLNPALDFYRFALERDRALHANLMKLVKEKKVSSAAVILGGFHAKGFESHLKEDGLSYTVVMPAMGSLKGKDAYGKVMEGEVSYKDFLQTSFYDAFVRHSSMKFVTELNEPDYRKVLKFWRDEMLRKLADEGRLAEAGSYTRYLDLLMKVYIEKFGTEKLNSKKREEILRDIEKEIEKFKQETLSGRWDRFQEQFKQFTEGLQTLAGRKELTPEKMKALVDQAGQGKTSTLQAVRLILSSNFPAEGARPFIEQVRGELNLDVQDLAGTVPVENVSRRDAVIQGIDALRQQLNAELARGAVADVLDQAQSGRSGLPADIKPAAKLSEQGLGQLLEASKQAVARKTGLTSELDILRATLNAFEAEERSSEGQSLGTSEDVKKKLSESFPRKTGRGSRVMAAIKGRFTETIFASMIEPLRDLELHIRAARADNNPEEVETFTRIFELSVAKFKRNFVNSQDPFLENFGQSTRFIFLDNVFGKKVGVNYGPTPDLVLAKVEVDPKGEITHVEFFPLDFKLHPWSETQAASLVSGKHFDPNYSQPIRFGRLLEAGLGTSLFTAEELYQADSMMDSVKKSKARAATSKLSTDDNDAIRKYMLDTIGLSAYPLRNDLRGQIRSGELTIGSALETNLGSIGEKMAKRARKLLLEEKDHVLLAFLRKHDVVIPPDASETFLAETFTRTLKAEIETQYGISLSEIQTLTEQVTALIKADEPAVSVLASEAYRDLENALSGLFASLREFLPKENIAVPSGANLLVSGAIATEQRGLLKIFEKIAETANSEAVTYVGVLKSRIGLLSKEATFDVSRGKIVAVRAPVPDVENPYVDTNGVPYSTDDLLLVRENQLIQGIKSGFREALRMYLSLLNKSPGDIDTIFENLFPEIPADETLAQETLRQAENHTLETFNLTRQNRDYLSKMLFRGPIADMTELALIYASIGADALLKDLDENLIEGYMNNILEWIEEENVPRDRESIRDFLIGKFVDAKKEKLTQTTLNLLTGADLANEELMGEALTGIRRRQILTLLEPEIEVVREKVESGSLSFDAGRKQLIQLAKEKTAPIAAYSQNGRVEDRLLRVLPVSFQAILTEEIIQAQGEILRGETYQQGRETLIQAAKDKLEQIVLALEIEPSSLIASLLPEAFRLFLESETGQLQDPLSTGEITAADVKTRLIEAGRSKIDQFAANHVVRRDSLHPLPREMPGGPSEKWRRLAEKRIGQGLADEIRAVRRQGKHVLVSFHLGTDKQAREAWDTLGTPFPNPNTEDVHVPEKKSEKKFYWKKNAAGDLLITVTDIWGESNLTKMRQYLGVVGAQMGEVYDHAYDYAGDVKLALQTARSEGVSLNVVAIGPQGTVLGDLMDQRAEALILREHFRKILTYEDQGVPKWHSIRGWVESRIDQELQAAIGKARDKVEAFLTKSGVTVTPETDLARELRRVLDKESYIHIDAEKKGVSDLKFDFAWLDQQIQNGLPAEEFLARGDFVAQFSGIRTLFELYDKILDAEGIPVNSKFKDVFSDEKLKPLLKRFEKKKIKGVGDVFQVSINTIPDGKGGVLKFVTINIAYGDLSGHIAQAAQEMGVGRIIFNGTAGFDVSQQGGQLKKRRLGLRIGDIITPTIFAGRRKDLPGVRNGAQQRLLQQLELQGADYGIVSVEEKTPKREKYQSGAESPVLINGRHGNVRAIFEETEERMEELAGFGVTSLEIEVGEVLERFKGPVEIAIYISDFIGEEGADYADGGVEAVLEPRSHVTKKLFSDAIAAAVKELIPAESDPEFLNLLGKQKPRPWSPPVVKAAQPVVVAPVVQGTGVEMDAKELKVLKKVLGGIAAKLGLKGPQIGQFSGNIGELMNGRSVVTEADLAGKGIPTEQIAVVLEGLADYNKAVSALLAAAPVFLDEKKAKEEVKRIFGTPEFGIKPQGKDQGQAGGAAQQAVRDFLQGKINEDEARSVLAEKGKVLPAILTHAETILTAAKVLLEEATATKLQPSEAAAEGKSLGQSPIFDLLERSIGPEGQITFDSLKQILRGLVQTADPQIASAIEGNERYFAFQFAVKNALEGSPLRERIRDGLLKEVADVTNEEQPNLLSVLGSYRDPVTLTALIGLAKKLTGRYAERQMRDFIRTIELIAGSLNDRIALPFLFEKFQSSDRWQKWYAALGLAAFDDQAVTDLVKNLLQTQNVWNWVMAASMMNPARYALLAPLVERGLQSQKAEIRSIAVSLMGKFGNARDIQLLTAVTNGPSLALAENALYAIKSIDEKEYNKLISDIQKRPEHVLFLEVARILKRQEIAARPKTATDPVLLDKTKASLLGVAIGDAIGMPVEFLSRSEIFELYGKEVDDFKSNETRFRQILLKGMVSDDTVMTIALARSLILESGFNGFDIGRQFSEISEGEDTDRFPNQGFSFSMLDVLRSLGAGLSWRLSGKADKEGNGAAMRTAPLGLLHYEDLEQLRAEVKAQASITHASPVAIAGAQAAAYVVARVLTKTSLTSEESRKLIEDTAAFVEAESPEMARKIRSLSPLLDRGDIDTVLQEIGTSSKAIDSVPAAIYIFLKNPSDFKTAIVKAINIDGDSDTIGAIVGAMSGALNGEKAIPENWLDRLGEKKLELRGLAEGLVQLGRKEKAYADETGAGKKVLSAPQPFRPDVDLGHVVARLQKPATYPVSSQKLETQLSWDQLPGNYQPVYAPPTAKVLKNPDADPEDYSVVLERIAAGEKKFESFEGPVRFDAGQKPLNPRGPTGYTGRGGLPYWGATFAVDPIITRLNPDTGKYEVLAVQRKDNGQWALPGGKVDKGEDVMTTLKRELWEETGAELDLSTSQKIYNGYVDDPRNTDNAWVETTAMHRHLTDEEVGQLKLKPGAGEEAVRWVPIEETLDNFYASHGDFMRIVYERLNYQERGDEKKLEKALTEINDLLKKSDPGANPAAIALKEGRVLELINQGKELAEAVRTVNEKMARQGSEASSIGQQLDELKIGKTGGEASSDFYFFNRYVSPAKNLAVSALEAYRAGKNVFLLDANFKDYEASVRKILKEELNATDEEINGSLEKLQTGIIEFLNKNNLDHHGSQNLERILGEKGLDGLDENSVTLDIVLAYLKREPGAFRDSLVAIDHIDGDSLFPLIAIKAIASMTPGTTIFDLPGAKEAIVRASEFTEKPLGDINLFERRLNPDAPDSLYTSQKIMSVFQSLVAPVFDRSIADQKDAEGKILKTAEAVRAERIASLIGEAGTEGKLETAIREILIGQESPATKALYEKGLANLQEQYNKLKAAKQAEEQGRTGELLLGQILEASPYGRVTSVNYAQGITEGALRYAFNRPGSGVIINYEVKQEAGETYHQFNPVGIDVMNKAVEMDLSILPRLFAVKESEAWGGVLPASAGKNWGGGKAAFGSPLKSKLSKDFVVNTVEGFALTEEVLAGKIDLKKADANIKQAIERFLSLAVATIQAGLTQTQVDQEMKILNQALGKYQALQAQIQAQNEGQSLAAEEAGAKVGVAPVNELQKSSFAGLTGLDSFERLQAFARSASLETQAGRDQFQLEILQAAKERFQQFQQVKVEGDLSAVRQSLEGMANVVEGVFSQNFEETLRKLTQDSLSQQEQDRLLGNIRLVVIGATVAVTASLQKRMSPDQKAALDKQFDRVRNELKKAFEDQHLKKLNLIATHPGNADLPIVLKVLGKYSELIDQVVFVHKKGENLSRDAKDIGTRVIPALFDEAHQEKLAKQLNNLTFGGRVFSLLTYNLSTISTLVNNFPFLTRIGEVNDTANKELAYDATIQVILKLAMLPAEELKQLQTGEKLKDFIESQFKQLGLQFSVDKDNNFVLDMARFVQSIVAAAEQAEAIEQAA